MTNLEIRAMLKRVDARHLRVEAGISPRTVHRALGITPQQRSLWERGKRMPSGTGGARWARFVRALENHAAVTAELEAAESEAA